MNTHALKPKPHPRTDRLDHIGKHYFLRLERYINDYCGLKLPPSKATMVEGRLRRRMQVLNFDTLNDYCEFVFDQGGLEHEGVYIVNVLTTNKTEFFREPKHFEFINNTVLPEILASEQGSIKAWSAASSTGAEPYTLAMIIDAFFADKDTRHYSILATDISTDVLGVAHRGIYPEERMTPVPKALRRKYVLQSKDRSIRLCRIAPHLRARIKFARLNLMDPIYPFDCDMDIIFCRNVLIYFDRPTQQAVLNKLCAHLRPGGYLFIGHSESITGMTLPVMQVANTIFQYR